MKRKPKLTFGARITVNHNRYVKYPIYYAGKEIGIIRGNQSWCGYVYQVALLVRIGGTAFEFCSPGGYLRDTKNAVRAFIEENLSPTKIEMR